MLSWTKEECPVNQWVPVENWHDVLAKDTWNPVHFVAGIAGQYEDSGLVIANRAFVLHL